MSLYAIKQVGGCIFVRNDGKPCIYATRDLAEKDFRSMPDVYTDYDHYEIVELPVISAITDCMWAHRVGNPS